MTGYAIINALSDFARRMDRLGIPYMVTGSFAMNPYVTARTTMDVDVILEITHGDESRIESALVSDYYVDARSIGRAIRDGTMFNVINNKEAVKIDCIVSKSSAFEKAKFERRLKTTIFGLEFWVISKEDLILSKLRWAAESLSERQFQDIRALIESGVDQPYIDEWIDREGLSHGWAEFEKWKIHAQK
jgi:hypothetical protein